MFATRLQELEYVRTLVSTKERDQSSVDLDSATPAVKRAALLAGEYRPPSIEDAELLAILAE